MYYTLEHKTKKRVGKGVFYPMGVSLTPEGANFAIYSQAAQEVFLLLFDKPSGMPTDIIKIEEKTKNIWHTFVYGIKRGQLYAYKIKGEYDPPAGLRFNSNKLLIDPYARAFSHKLLNKEKLLLSYNTLSPDKDLSFDYRDNTEVVPKCIIVDDTFDWQGQQPLETPFDKLIIYEAHLKGFTVHPSSKVRHAGTYLGFIEKIPYLKTLGINAVEFLPLQEFYVEDFLVDRKLTNYWGYNTYGFFSPEQTYGTHRYPGCQINEFKTMVRELHKAGIEVIMDVVYNHTAEGNEMGPTIFFKGIDNPTYYYLSGDPKNPHRYYVNYTGCGNTVNLTNPPVIRLVMDSLRFWAETMHIDGFRFDLASVLGREAGMFQKTASFFDAISQDPVLSHVKLIAEPWDLGTYQVGNFPIDWAEWNGKFRDTIRKFIKGNKGQIADLAKRLTGSADLYGDDGRSAYNSINFITSHDGFTMYDLVSYNNKHNENNKDCNKDGAVENYSWNCGIEGNTSDQNVLMQRKKMIKNFITLICVSLGTPMFMAGDEIMRTQQGNNNAYCQDNEISWFNWNFAKKNADMLEYFRKAIAFRKRYEVLHGKHFFNDNESNGKNIADCEWFDQELNKPDWNNPESRFLCYQLSGYSENSGRADYFIYFILNGSDKQISAFLPLLSGGMKWHRVADTSLTYVEDFIESGIVLPEQKIYISSNHSITILLGKK